MILTVRTIPNSSQDKVEKTADGIYRVHVRAVPDKGKANAAVLKLLSRELGLNVRDMKILTPASRTKKIAVKDVNA